MSSELPPEQPVSHDKHLADYWRLRAEDAERELAEAMITIRDAAEENRRLELANQQLSSRNGVLKAALAASQAENRKKTRLLEQAQFDKLTGLLTRDVLDALLETKVEDLFSTGENRRKEDIEVSTLTLIAADVNNLKLINDTYGDYAGDEAIRALGTSLKRNTRNGVDFAFRRGGDEFLLILTNVSPERAREIAETISDELSQVELKPVTDSTNTTSGPNAQSGVTVPDTTPAETRLKLSVSMGIATLTVENDRVDPKVFFNMANYAKKLAKERKNKVERSSIVVYEPTMRESIYSAWEPNYRVEEEAPGPEVDS